MKRRSFLQAVSGALGTCAAGGRGTGAAEVDGKVSGERVLPRRALGRTGRRVSIVGFPGLALIHQDQDPCNAAIRRAYERGVNYFDVAPAYGRGDAEIKMGVGLQALERERIFLACKTKARDREGARQELERSLERLKTKWLDLYQLHALIQPDEVEQALGPGGAMEAILEAKKEGKVRHIGFSAHTTKAALKAMRTFRFDTVMFPINFVEYYTRGFAKPVLELAGEQGAAVVAIKPMCRGAWKEGEERTRRWWYRPVEAPEEIDLALRFTLSRRPVVAGFPPAFLDLLDRALDAAPGYRPLGAEEERRLRGLASSCESVFRREEERVAGGCPGDLAPWPESPHEPLGGCPGRWA